MEVAAPIDLVALAALADGDQEFERELVSTFMSHAASALDSIRQALAIDDIATIQRSAHSLRGASANMQAAARQHASRAPGNGRTRWRSQLACGPWRKRYGTRCSRRWLIFGRVLSILPKVSKTNGQKTSFRCAEVLQSSATISRSRRRNISTLLRD